MESAAHRTAYTGEQAQVYDEERFESRGGARIHQVELGHLLAALQRLPGSARILEVGCGTGRLLLEGRAAGYCIDGADASPDMVQVLRAKAQQQDLDLRIAEAAHLPYPDASYDMTYAIRLLNQTESPDYALRVVGEMLRVTRPGGYVLIEFVNARRPPWLSGRATTRLTPAEVQARGAANGGEAVRLYGAFLLGMTAYAHAPRFLLGAVATVDMLLSRLLPQYCSRCYVLFRKRGNGQ